MFFPSIETLQMARLYYKWSQYVVWCVCVSCVVFMVWWSSLVFPVLVFTRRRPVTAGLSLSATSAWTSESEGMAPWLHDNNKHVSDQNVLIIPALLNNRTTTKAVKPPGLRFNTSIYQQMSRLDFIKCSETVNHFHHSYFTVIQKALFPHSLLHKQCMMA